MSTVISTFKFKRGTAERWKEVNPILQAGEPGFEIDSHKLKIGDGITPWKDLPYIEGKTELINFTSSADFPEIGNPNILYKASDELSLYQFNLETNSYEKISDGKGIDNITIINGGRA
jgi:hyaluronoglucosaminidase